MRRALLSLGPLILLMAIAGPTLCQDLRTPVEGTAPTVFVEGLVSSTGSSLRLELGNDLGDPAVDLDPYLPDGDHAWIRVRHNNATNVLGIDTAPHCGTWTERLTLTGGDLPTASQAVPVPDGVLEDWCNWATRWVDDEVTNDHTEISSACSELGGRLRHTYVGDGAFQVADTFMEYDTPIDLVGGYIAWRMSPHDMDIAVIRVRITSTMRLELYTEAHAENSTITRDHALYGPIISGPFPIP